MKKSFTAEQKTALVLDAFSGSHTIAELSSQHGVHATQITSWKNSAKQILKDGFSDKRRRDSVEQQTKITNLYELIGKRDAELEWFKKKLAPFGS
jgi:transposase-like protein